MDETSQSFGARWILPVSRPPLENASVVVSGGIICEIKPGGRSLADSDLGDVAICPALINAHTHLEFSALEQPLGTPGMPITDWIPLVVEYRNALSADPEGLAHAIQRGLEESASGGAAALGEIATSRTMSGETGSSDLNRLVHLERTGTREDQIEVQESQWLESLKDLIARPASLTGIAPGISPHAPYSLHPRLFERLIQLAQEKDLPVAMHLAESLAEIEWMKTGSGPFGPMLERLGADAQPRCFPSAMDYLERLGGCKRALVVHGNYLNSAEFDFLAARRETMFAVYCPRTHERFGHRRWPLGDCLQRGVSVALGTDSRASNPDLDMWAELRFAVSLHGGIPPAQLLQIATLDGARSLGMDQELGSIEPGKRACWLEVPLSGNITDPHEVLIADGVRPLRRNVS